MQVVWPRWAASRQVRDLYQTWFGVVAGSAPDAFKDLVRSQSTSGIVAGFKVGADFSAVQPSVECLTNPDIGSKLQLSFQASSQIGDAFANFVADPTQVDSILSGIEEQKSTYLS